jgi:LPXTG-motif cell wall-anchored protein
VADNAPAADQTADAGQKLPQTASPLPLLGLLGFGSMAAGLLGRKKK